MCACTIFGICGIRRAKTTTNKMSYEISLPFYSREDWISIIASLMAFNSTENGQVKRYLNMTLNRKIDTTGNDEEQRKKTLRIIKSWTRKSKREERKLNQKLSE